MDIDSKFRTNLKLGEESDSDDSDISLDQEQSNVDVGLIDELDPIDDEPLEQEEIELNRLLLKSPFFPSKIGGKPAWLDYANLPLSVGASSSLADDSKQRILLQCDACKAQLAFLLQIYAPIVSSDKNYSKIQNIENLFHRALFVFICINKECANKSFKCLRSQISRESTYFSYEAPPEAKSDLKEDLEASKEHLLTFYKTLHTNQSNMTGLCSVCGFLSTKKCSKCNFAFYCCQAHQVIDWTKLGHKKLCSNYLVESDEEKLKNWINDECSNLRYAFDLIKNDMLPEYEIIIEPESLDYKKLLAKEKKNDKKKYDETKLLDLDSNNNSKNEGDNDFDTIKENDYDKDFEKFKKISAHESTQVIRYDRGGKPLWCTKYGKLKKEADIPSCEQCGSKRIFEFQVTPQLLHYLKLDVDLSKQATSVDWAGLYIYTCLKSCDSAFNSYTSEFIYKQDFVS